MGVAAAMLPQVLASCLAQVQNLSRWHALTKREMMSSVPLPKVLSLLAQAMGKPREGLQKKPPPKLQCEWAKQPFAEAAQVQPCFSSAARKTLACDCPIHMLFVFGFQK
jgi:hypothetical protein